MKAVSHCYIINGMLLIIIIIIIIIIIKSRWKLRHIVVN
jgi:hypothetical protein